MDIIKMDVFKSGIIVFVVLLQISSKYTEGSIESILDDCCMTGSNWGSRGERCDSYPALVSGVSAEDQRNCRIILEVCCIKAKQQEQCENGHRDALQSQACVIRSDVFGSEQYKECCHCCQMGLSQRSVNGDCNLLTAKEFGGPCNIKFKECCSGSTNSSGNTDDINECELYPNRACYGHRCVNTIGSYTCVCNPGYTLATDGITCNRDPEVPTVQTCAEYNPCEHVCVDGADGVQCECHVGYNIERDGHHCTDIDECESGDIPCPIDTSCINTIGSFTCEQNSVQQNCSEGTHLDPRTRQCVQSDQEDCSTGYAYNTVTRECEDVNECAAKTDACLPTQRCENSIGSYSCRRIYGCGTGYSLDSVTQLCEDVDECELRTHDCGQGYNCVNLQGSYRCIPSECQQGYRFVPATGQCEPIRCPRGFAPDRRGLCRDINECEQQRDACSVTERCINTYGSYRCRNSLNCRSGYQVDPVTNTCVDVDECSNGSHNCRTDQQCINRAGSFICGCQKGYRLSLSGRCEDVNECLDTFVCPPNAECENTVGSFRCTCLEGLKFEGIRCVDINECEELSPCQHRCLNVYASYHCQCNSGYRVAADGRSCDDINECTQYGARGNPCVGNCENTIGSYKCSCPEGWRPIGSGRSCRDIDECRETPGICGNSPNTVCFNTRGSFKCPNVVCPRGFVKTSIGPRRNSIRCQKVQFPCPRGDTECRNRPMSYAYNFLSFPHSVKVPANLFSMSGPQSHSRRYEWELEVINVRALRHGVTEVNRGYFQLNKNPLKNEAVIALTYGIPGPQDIELRMTMMMFRISDNVYLGKAVSRIFLYVTDDM